MGTKFTTPIISGYNSTPPQDDGSQQASNLMTWAVVKTKLSDAIKNWIDTVNSRLTTHFDEGPVTKSTTYSTVDADYAKVIECDGTFTVSLQAPGTAGAGYRVVVKNAGSGTITVDVDGGANIDSASSVALAADGHLGAIVNAAATKYLTIAD